MKFTDNTLARLFEQAQTQIAKGESKIVLCEADTDRWSYMPLARAKAGVYYCALSESLMEQSDWQQAAFHWHFAGHAFRSVWMESKAAHSYLQSEECGRKAIAKMEHQAAKKQRAFDLRSLGRARECLRNAGQTWKLARIDAMIAAELASQAQALDRNSL